MEYGILIVEDGNELYQVLGAVSSIKEARDLAKSYVRVASPENQNTTVPPETFVITRRNTDGYYTVRQTLNMQDGDE